MIACKAIRQRLKEYEAALCSGLPLQVLQGLNVLLGQLDCGDPQAAFTAAAVLELMSRAAYLLEDQESAALFLERAVAVLEDCRSSAPDEADIFLSLAQTLLQCGRYKEALHFAGTALTNAAEEPEQYQEDELAVILRRYARIARQCGESQDAYFALTLALLVIHETSGLESDVARELLMFSAGANSDSSGDAVSRIASYLLSVRGFQAAVLPQAAIN